MQQQLTANNYPGLLDGIEPSCSFPDMWKNFHEIIDCSLMLRYMKTTAPAMLAGRDRPQRGDEQRQRVARHVRGQNNTGETWGNHVRSAACRAADVAHQPPRLPTWIYNATTNRTARAARSPTTWWRCSAVGRRASGRRRREDRPTGLPTGPTTTSACSTASSVAIAGTITPEMFVDLNEKIGGRDIDLNFVPQRTVADAAALNIVYRTGQLNMLNNVDIPVMDNRGCRSVEVHSCYHSYVTRARILQSRPGATNHVTFFSSPGDTAFETLDRWVAAVKADTSSRAAGGEGRSG